MVGCGRVQSTPSTSTTRDRVPEAGKRQCAFEGFAPPVSYAAANEPLSIAAIDRTNDGHLDLIVGERGNDVASTEFLKNRGDGTFVSSPGFGSNDNNVANVVFADFDGDGKIDLASQSNGVLGVDLGTNDGFAPELVTTPTPEMDGQLVLGDYDYDGRPDLVFAGYDMVETVGGGNAGGLPVLPGPEPEHFALNVFLSSVHGTFGPPTTLETPPWGQTVVGGDFDGDGLRDVAELGATSGGGFRVFFNAGDGTFRAPVSYVASTGWIAYGLGVADFDGDGNDDISTTTTLNPNLADEANVLEMFTGARSGSLAGPADYDLDRTPTVYRIVTGDFNGDTKPDLAMVIGQTPTGALLEPIPVLVFENLGAGTFASPVTYGVAGDDSTAATDIAAGDFNGDGVTDIAVTTSGETAPYPVAVNVLLSKCE